MIKALGKLPSPEQQATFARSAQWDGKIFRNIEPTEVLREGTSYSKMLRQVLNRPKDTKPSHVLPSVRVDLHHLPDVEPQVVWFGHSSYLISHNGYRILVDPVLFGTSAPVSFIGQPFAVTARYTPDDIPPIDLLVLSHDHYDHLDVVTLTKLRDRIRRIICPLGVSAHLKYWGFDPSIITEVDWHERVVITTDISLTALPARHFSGRMFTRGKSLWASYALQLRNFRMFLGGDSGYDKQFKLIGAQHGPFDMALIECGQYGEDWPMIHMFPEQTAQAAIDVKAQQLLPVHWAKFVLANHAWNESIERLVRASTDAPYALLTPTIGAATTIGRAADFNPWWTAVHA